MVRVPLPPLTPNLAGSATAVTGHLEVEGPVMLWVDEVQATHRAHVRITPTVVVSVRILPTRRARNRSRSRTAELGYKKHSSSFRLRLSYRLGSTVSDALGPQERLRIPTPLVPGQPA
jgi:hypothetical protein